MQVTVVVLAYNEERNIEQTLVSLLKQTVFAADAALRLACRMDVLVVPNGCRDRTADVAEQVLVRLQGSPGLAPFTATVHAVDRPGKSNAWNVAVHEASPAETDVFVFIDADIEFEQVETIERCLTRLLKEPARAVVVDRPIKRFPGGQARGWLQRLSMRVSSQQDDARPGIAGSFYCARAELVREIWMPVGLSGEDGYVYNLVTTDLFRRPQDTGLVVREPGTGHFYEGLTLWRDIVHHEVRLVIATTLNCYLCWDGLLHLTSPVGSGAGALVRDLNQARPDWYGRYVHNEVANRGWWVLPRGMFLRRIARARGGSLKRWPLVIAATLFDWMVFLIANRRLKRGSVVGFW